MRAFASWANFSRNCERSIFLSSPMTLLHPEDGGFFLQRVRHHPQPRRRRRRFLHLRGRHPHHLLDLPHRLDHLLVRARLLVRRQRDLRARLRRPLDRLDDLRKRLRRQADRLLPPLHFPRPLLRRLHRAVRRRLDLRDDPADRLRRLPRLLRQAANLRRHDPEPAPVLPRRRRLDRRVQRQKVDLPRDLLDDLHHLPDLVRLLSQEQRLPRDVPHALLDLGHRLDALASQRRPVLRHLHRFRRRLLHRFRVLRDLPRRPRQLLHRRRHLRHRRRLLRRARRLVLDHRQDVRGERPHARPRLLDLPQHRPEVLRHPVERPGQRTDLVETFLGDLLPQLAPRHLARHHPQPGEAGDDPPREGPGAHHGYGEHEETDEGQTPHELAQDVVHLPVVQADDHRPRRFFLHQDRSRHFQDALSPIRGVLPRATPRSRRDGDLAAPRLLHLGGVGVGQERPVGVCHGKIGDLRQSFRELREGALDGVAHAQEEVPGDGVLDSLEPRLPAPGEPFRQRVPDEGVGEDREDGRHRDDVQGERQHETNRQAVPLHLESRHCAVSPPKPRTARSLLHPEDGGFFLQRVRHHPQPRRRRRRFLHLRGRHPHHLLDLPHRLDHLLVRARLLVRRQRDLRARLRRPLDRLDDLRKRLRRQADRLLPPLHFPRPLLRRLHRAVRRRLDLRDDPADRLRRLPRLLRQAANLRRHDPEPAPVLPRRRRLDRRVQRQKVDLPRDLLDDLHHLPDLVRLLSQEQRLPRDVPHALLDLGHRLDALASQRRPVLRHLHRFRRRLLHRFRVLRDLPRRPRQLLHRRRHLP